jgi:hypothetical protein
MLRRVGFNMAGCDWISVLISTASTRVLLNGDCGSRICHARGLHQGDPLSPMLFLLVMEALNTLIRKADSWSLLHPLGIAGMPHRTTIYANDMVLFIHLAAHRSRYGVRGPSSTCLLYVPCQVVDFPLTYLGMPLSVTKIYGATPSGGQAGRSVARLEGTPDAQEWPPGADQINLGRHARVLGDQHRASSVAAQSFREDNESIPLDGHRRGQRWQMPGGLEPGAAPLAARWPQHPRFQASGSGAQVAVAVAKQDGPSSFMGCLASQGGCHIESFLLGFDDLHSRR